MKPVDVQESEYRAGPPQRSFRGRVLLYLVRTVLPLLVLAGGFAAYKALEASRVDIVKRPPQERVWAVNTITANYSTHRPDLILFGETFAGRKIDLRALVTGEVIRVSDSLREGAEIDKGALLFEIDPFFYQGAVDEANANLQEAEARLVEIESRIALEGDALKRAGEQLELANRDLKRAKELLKRGNLSEKSVDDRALIVSQREQSVEQRESNLRIEGARGDQQRAVITRLSWRLRKAQRDLENTRIKAPFDAFVRGVGVDIGRTVSANDVVATLLDRDWLEVSVTLSDQQYGRIADGQGNFSGRAVKIRWRVGSKVIEYSGHFERVAAEIDSQSGGVEVYARIDLGESDALLRAGAFVEIIAEDIAYENSVRLPETALYDSNLVYVVVDDRLEVRTVEQIGRDGSSIFVIGDLREGEHVVTSRISEIGQGLKVEETRP